MRNSPKMMQVGFTLIELMISLVLGLLVVGAAGALFLSNQRIYSSTETLNHIQENGRTAFEMMSRDIREAAATPCGLTVDKLDSILNTAVATNALWTNYKNGIYGEAGDKLSVFSGNGLGADDIRITKHENPAAVLDVSSVNGIAENDILIACNPTKGFIFQATSVNGSSLNVGHNSGGGQSINCGKNFDVNCTNGNEPTAYCFSYGGPCNGRPTASVPPSTIVKPAGVQWYVDANNNLIRKVLSMSGGADNAQTIAEGVTSMAVKYQMAPGSGFVAAGSVTDWKTVTAVEVTLQIAGTTGAQSAQGIKGTGGDVLNRTFKNVVALRNRQGVL